MSTHIMAKVWPLQMTAARKAVLVSLADQANDQGFCWPSVGTIANRTCLSDRAVRLALRWLEKSGYMYRHYRYGSSTYYNLTPESGSPECDSPLNEMQDPPECDSGEGGTRCRTPRNVIPPESSGNRQGTVSEPSGEGRAQPKRATQMPENLRPSENHERLAAEMGVNLEAEFEQFCDHHAAKGSTYKDWGRALNTWLRNARRFGRANHGSTGKKDYERGIDENGNF